MKGGAKELRKAAIRLATLTHTGIDFFLSLPLREFVEINNEVAEEWQETKH